MNNILKVGESTIVFDGGNPLPGCPESFEQADKWANEANKEKDDGGSEPVWSFDCGFKLDFDGPLLSVSSRFYPPKTHYGPKWDGSVTVFLLSKQIYEKNFVCDTLEQLKDEVEKYVGTIVCRISL